MALSHAAIPVVSAYIRLWHDPLNSGPMNDFYYPKHHWASYGSNLVLLYFLLYFFFIICTFLCTVKVTLIEDIISILNNTLCTYQEKV